MQGFGIIGLIFFCTSMNCEYFKAMNALACCSLLFEKKTNKYMPLSCYFVCKFCKHWCAVGTPAMFIVSGLYSHITGRLELSWRRLSSLAAPEFVVSTALDVAGHGKAGVVAMFCYRYGTLCPCLNVCTTLSLTYLTIICTWMCWYLLYGALGWHLLWAQLPHRRLCRHKCHRRLT